MEVRDKIMQVIDTSVRPYLNGHGGDIGFHRWYLKV